MNKQRNINTRDVVAQYIEQRSRGTEGFGFSYLNPKGQIQTRRYTHEAVAFHDLARLKSHMILLHHRRPTSTKNNAYQNHPIMRITSKASYALVHNGMIYNSDELKEGVYKDIPFATLERRAADSLLKTDLDFNDSEALLHALIDYKENSVPIPTEGSVAFILLVGDPTGILQTIHYGRNVNPLNHAILEDGTEVISSETSVSGMEVEADRLFTIDYTSKKLKLTSIEMDIPTWKKKNNHQQWDNDYESNSTWLARFNKKPIATLPAGKKSEREEQVERQKDYVDSVKFTEEYLEHLKGLLPGTMSIFERQRELRMIDDAIRDINDYSTAAYKRITGKVEDLVKGFGIQRIRFLPSVIEVLPSSNRIGPSLSSRFTDPLQSMHDDIEAMTMADIEDLLRRDAALSAMSGFED